MGALDSIRLGSDKLTKTVEDITIPIDYNGGAVGDPIDGTVFRSQADVDRVLAANSWTAFKHIEAAYRALPDVIDNTVEFEVAKGVQRPEPAADPAFSLEGKRQTINGLVRVSGCESSEWDAFDGLADLAITAVQTGSGDPYVTVSGTPFAGKDLQGLFAVFSTGQVELIHDHDDSTIHVLAELSPDPTAGTVTIARPGTEFRNSLDDVNDVAPYSVIQCSTNNVEFGFITNLFEFNRILVDTMGAFGGFSSYAGSMVCNYCIVDCLRSLSGSENGDGYLASAGEGTRMTLVRCSKIATPASNASDGSIYVTDRSLWGTQYCYFRGGQDGVQVTRAAGSVVHTVFDSICDASAWGDGSAGTIRLTEAGKVGGTEFWHIASGAYQNEIRRTKGGAAGLYMSDGALLREGYGAHIRFVDNTGPCVRIRGRTNFTTQDRYNGSPSTPGLVDGGGNLDVGIEIEGQFNRVRIGPDETVTGALGDLRIAGVLGSYSEVEGGGDIEVANFNTIAKEP